MLSIKYTDSVGKIQCMNYTEFPVIKQMEDCEHFKISQKGVIFF